MVAAWVQISKALGPLGLPSNWVMVLWSAKERCVMTAHARSFRPGPPFVDVYQPNNPTASAFLMQLGVGTESQSHAQIVESKHRMSKASNTQTGKVEKQDGKGDEHSNHAIDEYKKYENDCFEEYERFTCNTHERELNSLLGCPLCSGSSPSSPNSRSTKMVTLRLGRSSTSERMAWGLQRAFSHIPRSRHHSTQEKE